MDNLAKMAALKQEARGLVDLERGVGDPVRRGEHFLQVAADGVADQAGTEDAHLFGPAAELLLRLWGRPANVTVSGDPAAEALLRGR